MVFGWVWPFPAGIQMNLQTFVFQRYTLVKSQYGSLGAFQSDGSSPHTRDGWYQIHTWHNLWFLGYFCCMFRWVFFFWTTTSTLLQHCSNWSFNEISNYCSRELHCALLPSSIVGLLTGSCTWPCRFAWASLEGRAIHGSALQHLHWKR